MKIQKITPFLVDRCLRVPDGGYVVVQDRPGIGAETLAKFPYRPHTIGGWFKEDGSVAHYKG
jgi:hypothetical protein